MQSMTLSVMMRLSNSWSCITQPNIYESKPKILPARMRALETGDWPLHAPPGPRECRHTPMAMPMEHAATTAQVANRIAAFGGFSVMTLVVSLASSQFVIIHGVPQTIVAKMVNAASAMMIVAIHVSVAAECVLANAMEGARLNVRFKEEPNQVANSEKRSVFHSCVETPQRHSND
mmetsp:Transcript_21023/g.58219  ORF Transcript_21023/g.58219 Transcript_21023/m.58219 type:complete len:176 (-) Transcript_21023:272-799(-)